ncbi:MAG: HAMP domain-containing protein [Gemmatimonadaceae bacterium]|nr:HAMP domain-containing protein [Chitinophagaceae bacterium]
MVVSIRTRIYFSFFLLVVVFVVNGIITFNTLYENKKMSSRIYGVIDPSLHSLEVFQKMLIESKMNATNWVFLRASQQDKDALLKLHNHDYKQLKAKLIASATQWGSKEWADSINISLKNFESIMNVEKIIIASLARFEDYDDPLIKLEAERMVEDEILPGTASVMSSVESIIRKGREIRFSEAEKLSAAAQSLQSMILMLATLVVCIALFLSFYTTRVIRQPITRISEIVKELGRGITRKIEDTNRRDEIGEMIRSVNSLSDNLQRTALFAHEVGKRNFDMHFEPLSCEDTLGKALISMRDNLRVSEAELLASSEDLLRRNKDLEEFTYIVSHNLRAPVANIMGLWTMLNSAEGQSSESDRTRILDGLTASVKKLDEIINELNNILQGRSQTASSGKLSASILSPITEGNSFR